MRHSTLKSQDMTAEGSFQNTACVCSVTQSCPTLCDPTDCSLPGSSVHRIFQARILEQVAISYSRGSSQPRDQTCISCISCIGGWILYHLGSLKVSLLLTITNVTTRRVLSTHPWHQSTWCLNSQTWDCPIKGFANFRFWMTLTNTLKGTFQNCAH